MGHDIEARLAAQALAVFLKEQPQHCFKTPPDKEHISTDAASIGRHEWPHPDGSLTVTVAPGPTKRTDYGVGIEFKRHNEGIHGVLTAMGQAHAYLLKEQFSAALIVIPDSYPGLPKAGEYVAEVLLRTSKAEEIGVVSYQKPDLDKLSPFEGKLIVRRAIRLDSARALAALKRDDQNRARTQWAHVREGSTEPDALYRYLQAVKLLGGGGFKPYEPKIPPLLANAVKEVAGGRDPLKYLAYAPSDDHASVAWRHFWFTYVLSDEMMVGWTNSGKDFAVHQVGSNLLTFDGERKKKFFSGRSDSIKNKLVTQLNEGKISEPDAWKELAKNFNARAHSYREDLDSGCEHLGLVGAEGRLTDPGYRFVDACERAGSADTGLPRALFMRAALVEGGLGAFLHYIHRLSEERFSKDPLAFGEKIGETYKFKKDEYVDWLRQQLADRLRVLKLGTGRGGEERRAFQGELALLRNLGLVGDFRIGLGLSVNWPAVQDALVDY